jgi:hypothetical protein
MISQADIKSMLTTIARNNGLVGDSTNMLIDELVYNLYHQQLEVLNAVQESNLSTAKLINSKIRNCMNVMYPVYRGKNARVKLNFINNSILSFNKFDLIYTSNTFKVYADEGPDKGAWNLTRSDISSSNGDPKTIIGILAKNDLLQSDIILSNQTEYYIDFIIDYEVMSNISEDIQVFIGPNEDALEEYPTTRNFYDFIQQSSSHKHYKVGSIYYYVDSPNQLEWSSIDTSKMLTTDQLKKLDEVSADAIELTSETQRPILPISTKDKIFVLTIPDYGIRLFKNGYFKKPNMVRIRALQYTTADDINYDEFEKISISGTELILPTGQDKLSKDNIVFNYHKVDSNGNIDYTDTGLISEVERDNDKSILYNANLYERLQGKILSNSDLNSLFSDYFRSDVISATNTYIESPAVSINDTSVQKFSDGNVMIYYVPQHPGLVVDPNSFRNGFIYNYGSYFINKTLSCIPGKLIYVYVDIHLHVSITETLTEELNSIFSKYENKLNDPLLFDKKNASLESSNLINQRKIRADISKLSGVEYVDSLLFTRYKSYDSVDESEDNKAKLEKYGVTWVSPNKVNSNNLDGRSTIQELPVAYIPQLMQLSNEGGELRVDESGNPQYSLLLVPTYYKFIINTRYSYSYEDVSR